MANGFHIEFCKQVNKLTAFSKLCFRRKTCCRVLEGL